MPDRRDREKVARIDEAYALLAKRKKSGAELAAFCEALFEHGAAEDVVAYSAEELIAFTLESWKFSAARKPGDHKIQVYNPDFGDAASAARKVTVVELVNDNMPFLVDSVMGELKDAGVDLRLVLHPILDVSRDGKGKLTAFNGPVTAGGSVKAIQESHIQVHVTRIDSRNERDELVKKLDTLLAEVRRSVEDWRKMLQRLDTTIADYKETPPPIPVDDLAEAIQFLEWLRDDNFTFLGMRDYVYSDETEAGEMASAGVPGLGLLRDPNVFVLRRGTEMVTMTPEIRDFLMRPEALIITKANVRSRIHRRVHMDYIGIKTFHEDGSLAGELRVVGLFTSTAYIRSTRRIPYLRRKVDQILSRAGYEESSHSGKALLNVLEFYPRDELFQIDLETLYDNAVDILELYERPRVRLLVRLDKFDRFVSILIYTPRDHYTTEVRRKMSAMLCEAYDGRLSAWNVAFLENGLARVHMIVGRYSGETPNPPREELEAAITELVRTWADKFRSAIRETHDPEATLELTRKYMDAFSAGYRETYSITAAERDIEIIETLYGKRRTGVDFYRREGTAANRIGLKLYNVEKPIPLSERVPILEAMGFRVINERTHEITPGNGVPAIYLHDMMLERRGGADIHFTDELDDRLEAMFLSVWNEEAESDGYNALVLNADLNWRDIAMLRTLSRYLRQVRIPYSQGYMWGAFNRYPEITRRIVELFHHRFDPEMEDADRSLGSLRIEQEITSSLEDVASLDDDRILRRFVNLIGACLRTSFFQTDSHGAPKPTISIKLNPRQLEEVPEPRPFREIFVYSPRIEGVHLRFGLVARGGLRWSDRPQDFRTEVLGLVKAQQVKNAVIVPVGSKGGFVPMMLPETCNRDEIFKEGTAAYKIFVSSLLDITDNLDGDVVVPPYRVVRHDGDDPYLVVAADKGTATFSDTANAIADAKNFWLSDAFASGGSAGYDHKKMGITARGAWEAVKRHFREMDIDIQTTPVTVAGVGDMSGDVFGNGMLLSRALKVVAAFDHRDIFIDPSPDPEASFKERERLFRLGRSSWQDYDTGVISKGGGVFSRQLKSITLSKEIQDLLGLAKTKATPQEVMNAILKAPVDLFWFGGIGTYVRGSGESDAEVGDRANDAIRVTARQFGCKVVGEGANLGMTQKARIEFGLRGGRCNSDAIDNSGGVNSSDVEVNIKIAFRAAMRAGKLDLRKRNRLLVTMTEEVAALVLRNNYLQTLSLSLAERRRFEDFGFQRRLMQQLESRNLLDRDVEQLPDDAALAEREKDGRPLTRAEIAVLIAYAKITLFDDLVQSRVPDDDYLARELFRYFPQLMQDDYREEIAGHRLRREIIATVLANSMINRGGPTFMVRIGDQTGAAPGEIAQSFAAVRDAFDVGGLVEAIDALDNEVPGAVQLSLYMAVQDLLLEETVWFLRNVASKDGIAAVVERFSSGLKALAGEIDGVLPEGALESVTAKAAEWTEAGVPEELAVRLSRLPAIATVPDIILVAEATEETLKSAAAVYFRVGGYFRIGRLEELSRTLDIRDYYDGLALDRARQTLGRAHRKIAEGVLTASGTGDPFDSWVGERRHEVERTNQTVTSITESGELTVSRFAVAASLLADLAEL
ncbi:glutamate dehydrogenase [Rhodobium orientis]|uniref:NAD-glutamate dehydrogenase n=1 Tax=Rhodobium orientis TaxID=34017 RepID=A0A327JG33_9HYPH|nr:NAD-glutamate dehydrogenase [Rhodobium orientis]MBB4304469.1 glutamate dehydrogenase [Rhodobium orientis]MBK5948061.1 NAD-glutamate dehydrogenase [Rhodobium orientis]RAI25360.1 NAD-glutamate dehydrogenase [Rhodobium orientis]